MIRLLIDHDTGELILTKSYEGHADGAELEVVLRDAGVDGAAILKRMLEDEGVDLQVREVR